jgi:hypothetical protein
MSLDNVIMYYFSYFVNKAQRLSLDGIRFEAGGKVVVGQSRSMTTRPVTFSRYIAKRQESECLSCEAWYPDRVPYNQGWFSASRAEERAKTRHSRAKARGLIRFRGNQRGLSIRDCICGDVRKPENSKPLITRKRGPRERLYPLSYHNLKDHGAHETRPLSPYHCIACIREFPDGLPFL